MPNETAISNSTNCSAWQQSLSTNSNNNTIDTPPDSAVLPVRYKFKDYSKYISILFSQKIGQVLLRQLMNNPFHPNQIHLEHVIRKVRENLSLFVTINSFLGKQKWVPLPLESNEVDTTEVSSTHPQSNVKPTATKSNRAGRNSRNGRGGNRNRTRSLDGATPKRNRKNRATGAAYNAYQDYYAYYCML
jgi:hypothetical protein